MNGNTGQPESRVSAADLAIQMFEPTDEPLRLSGVRVAGELSLRLRRIRRAIEVTDCILEGAVDLRNAHFAATVSFTRCRFQGPFNCGDRELSHTRFDEDIIFNDSLFEDTAWFIGLRCAGSGSFHRCTFEAQTEFDPTGMVPRAVDFNGAHFGKEMAAIRTTFRGHVSFNALQCGVGGFFDEARFECGEPQAVDFVASRFGVVCQMVRATFHGGADFSGLTCGLSLFLDLARFEHPHHSVSLSNISTPLLFARGVLFRGPAYITGIRVENVADFRPFAAALDVPPEANAPEEEISPELRRAFQKARIPLPEEASVSTGGSTTEIVLPRRKSGYHLTREGELVSVAIPSAFESEVRFDHSHIKWNLVLTECVFEDAASFNGMRCDGEGFFERTRFKAPEERIDLRFSSFGVNLQMYDAECRGILDLEGASIKGELVFAGAVLHAGIDLTNASMRRLVLGDPFPFRGSRSRFRGVSFDLLGEPVSTGRRVWEQFVEAQDPHHFTRDPYLTLERYYRTGGQQEEADRIYYAGRCTERRYARKKGTVVTWSKWEWLVNTFWKWLTGYGVQPGRLIWWISAFIVMGVVVFWPDSALRPKPADPPTRPAPTAGAVVSPPAEPIARGAGAPVALATATRPPGPRRKLRRFVARLGFSIDEFLPLDLRFAEDLRPVGGWRQAYAAVHITAGWILIPLLVGAVSGLLGKH